MSQSQTAPYWGQLPGPKVAGQTPSQARRQSQDATGMAPVTRPNRSSVQTAASVDAPTESTLSPYASPTTSSFQAQGLAPRPPSFPYGADQYPPELMERRRRRGTRQPDLDVNAASEMPPAAPDVPRAPPSSYRPPFGAGAASSPVPYGGPGGPAAGPPYQRRHASQPTQMTMEPDEYDMPTGVPERHNSQRSYAYDPNAPEARRHQSGTIPTGLRVETNGVEPEGRKKFAVDRSPLQRLELTLDSITKEEKRARVAAAEERARQRALEVAEQSQIPVPLHGRDTERKPPTAGVGTGRQRSVTDPAVQGPPGQAQHPIAAHRGPLNQNPPEEGKKYGSVPVRVAVVEPPAGPRSPVTSSAKNSGVPQRNLSFRERAAKGEVSAPGTETISPVSPPGAGTGGGALGRSGSNKLRKDPPPTDARFSRRSDAVPERPLPDPYGRDGPNDARMLDYAKPAGPSVRIQMPSHPAAAPVPPQPTASAAPAPLQVERRAPPFSAGRRPADAPREDYRADYGPAPTPSKLTKAPSQRKKAEDDRQAPRTSAPENGFFRRGAALAGGAGALAAAVGRDNRGAASKRGGASGDSDDSSSADSEGHPAQLKPGQGVFQPTQYLDEWKRATVGTLSGSLLDLGDVPPADNTDKAWWETPPSKRRGSTASRPRNAEAFDGEYDEANGPTRFKPPLYLKCGPLLRYCGIRTERVSSRSTRGGGGPSSGAAAEREIWRGSVMIVTHDADSSYEIAPTLRLFVQPIELLPPPPVEIRGGQVLAPEYVDPLAGHPRLGRTGETLYVRPVEHLEEARDLSRDETDEGLFESTRSPPDEPLEKGMTDLPGSFASRRRRARADGEKLGKYKEVRGFRLHAERGCTFWRFNIEVELRAGAQQRVAYRINRGPPTGFWVPARGEPMHIMFYSCNGFSYSVDPDQFSGPDPMWRDVLNTHQTRPFHVMLGGGDQIYNDAVVHETALFGQWTALKNPLHKHGAPFTAEMQDELEGFYLERYCMWFSQGLFGMANGQIPMVNMFDDHDIIDGFGSYPDHFMRSPVFSGLGNVAFKYYMLFQHQSVADETEAAEPSWALGAAPGPYIHERSRSLLVALGAGVTLLAVDCRTERTRGAVMADESWQQLMDRCYAEVHTGRTKHLLVLLGVPIAYPRLVWLENLLTSRLFGPVKALAKMGLMGGLLNRFDGGVEVLDDLDDHWTAKHHKLQRKEVIEDLQDLAVDRSVRVTILSGDVHLAAAGQFYSDPALKIPKHRDYRYMPNVISSAIANTPPPDMLADILNKRNKIHVLDNDDDEDHRTFEDMIPLFEHGVDGKPRNNKCLLPHRNWCSIRPYVPGSTPPPTPPPLDGAADPAPAGGIIRRLTKRRTVGASAQPRPPVSGGLFRSFSSRRVGASVDHIDVHGEPPQRPPSLTRTMSLTRADFTPGSLFRRLSSRRSKDKAAARGKRPDDGGINGQWGDSDDERDIPPAAARRLGLRGGGRHDSNGSNDEFYAGDESYFTTRVPPAPQPRPRRGFSPRRDQDVYGDYDAASDMYDDHYNNNAMLSRPANAAHTRKPFVPGGAPGALGGGALYTPPAMDPDLQPKPLFHRTPTNLTAKQMKFAHALEVNLEDALEVCFNVEVNQKDPTGITTPYRLLIPRLWFDEGDEPPLEAKPEPTGIKRFLSLRRDKSSVAAPPMTATSTSSAQAVASAPALPRGGAAQPV